MAEKCILCGREGIIAHSALRDRLYGVKGEWNMVECTNPACGLLWLDPPPSKEELARFYENYYTHGHNEKKAERPAIIEQLKGMIYRLTGKRQAEEMYLSQSRPGKLLDIGCGDGEFLNKMKIKGWRVEGIDPDEKAVSTCKGKYGINCRRGEMETTEIENETYDAITAKHVLEHIYDPLMALKKCHAALKKGGVLTLLTPNLRSLGHRLYNKDWRGLEPPRHLFLFSANALSRILRQAGFTKIKLFSTAANANIIVEGSMRIKQGKTNPILSWFYMVLEALLIRLGFQIGEELVLVARK